MSTVMRMRRLLVVLSVLALCLPALALADGSPHVRTLVGTLTANPSGSVTVTSSHAALTCSVPDRAIGSVAKLKLGGHFKLACRLDGTHLVLVSLKRVESPGNHGSSGSGSGDTSKHGDDSTSDTTHPPTTPPPPTGSGAKDAHGTITALGGGSITVARDGGTSLTCSITDGQLNSLQHVFHVGAGIAIVCNGDGALISASPITDTSTGGGDHGGTTTTGTTPPPPPPTHTVLGVVSFLSSTGVAVTPDGHGTPLTCAITPAPDSTAAAAKLKLGGRFGIVCRLDGTHYVLSGSTPLP